MKGKKLLFGSFLSIVTTIGVIAALAFANRADGEIIRASGGTGNYTCGSIHYSMNDSTKQGSTKLSPTGLSAGTTSYESKDYDNAFGVSDGVTIKSVTVTNYSYYENNSALKFGKSATKSGSISYTFSENIIGVDIYANGWGADGTITLTVNTDYSTTFTGDVSGSGTQTLSYTKYSFNFASATKTLTFGTELRCFFGDVAIRVAA